MRAHEFIVEYNQAKTAQVFGHKLLAALAKDKSRGLPGRLTMIKSLIGSEINSAGQGMIQPQEPERSDYISDILSVLERSDPTTNKQCVQWLAKCYANEDIKLEDIMSTLSDAIKTYMQMKAKRILPPELNDLNKLGSGNLSALVRDPEFLGKLQSEEQKGMPRGQYKEVLNNAVVRIIHPEDMAAAQFWGQGTQWCTAARNNNMFDRYNRDGPLLILIPKKANYEGEKYQAHFASGSFMDEQDDGVNFYDLVFNRFGDLLPLFKSLDPTVSEQVIFADDNVLEKLVSEIKEIGLEFLNDIELDWETEDESYSEFLHSEGYVDEEGDIDWEKAPSYLEYNDEAREIYTTISDALDMNPLQIKELVSEYSEDQNDSEMVQVKDLEAMMAWNVSREGNRVNSDVTERIVERIMQDVVIKQNGGVWQAIHIRRNAKGQAINV
jgi:hypothetical protein